MHVIVVNDFAHVNGGAAKIAILASLGLRTLDEAIGRSDLLQVDRAMRHWKAAGLDLGPVLTRPDVPAGTALRCTTTQGPTWSTVTGTTFPSSRKTCVIPTFLPKIPGDITTPS